ncbi:MAG: YaiI/YqxD family protein [Geothermobacteraceae bacterium]
MRIWVDADACPRSVKEILYRAATRTGTQLILVANQPLKVPPSPHIRAVRVAAGMDVADAHIAANVAAGDLVITGDIPLAATILRRQAHVLDPRGTRINEDNIHERLSMRNLLDELRGSGIETGGPAPLTRADRQTFASRLDQFLARSQVADGGRPA